MEPSQVDKMVAKVSLSVLFFQLSEFVSAKDEEQTGQGTNSNCKAPWSDPWFWVSEAEFPDAIWSQRQTKETGKYFNENDGTKNIFSDAALSVTKSTRTAESPSF